MIVREEIELAQHRAAVAFQVELEKVQRIGTGPGASPVADARRCVCWILDGRGYTTTEIARALHKTRDSVRSAIAHTERILRNRPAIAEKVAA